MISIDVLFHEVLFPISVILGFVCLVRLSLLGVQYENEMKKEKPDFKTSLKLHYSYGIWFAFPIFIVASSKNESTRLIIRKFNKTTLMFWILVVFAAIIKQI